LSSGTTDLLLHSSGSKPSETNMPDGANPKTDPTSNAEKNPEDWVTGDEPMTGAQASYLKTLSEQAHDPDA
jgi:hypothetical protein